MDDNQKDMTSGLEQIPIQSIGDSNSHIRHVDLPGMWIVPNRNKNRDTW